MTEEKLKEIEERYLNRNKSGRAYDEYAENVARDLGSILAEVQRLREECRAMMEERIAELQYVVDRDLGCGIVSMGAMRELLAEVRRLREEVETLKREVIGAGWDSTWKPPGAEARLALAAVRSTFGREGGIDPDYMTADGSIGDLIETALGVDHG